MPQYEYEVKKAPGEAVTGVLEAENERAALARLRDMGYFPTAIREHIAEAKRDTLRRALTRISLKERNIFFRQLANLIESGMPLTRALSTLVQQTTNHKMADVIEQLRDDIQKGSTFAEALERRPRVFTVMQCNMVNAGESGGMLEDVLWRIVAFGERDEELRGKVISAMIYPVFLMLMGSVALFILVSFVFPKFITVFADFGVPLPFITRFVLAICAFMGSYWWAVLLGIIVVVVLVVSYWRSASGRMQIDRSALRIVVIRTVIQKYVMAQFARTLGTLLDNGVPVLRSLRITADILSNKAVAAELDHIHARVSEGDSISSGLADAKYFPPLVVNMFAVGEESGRLGAVTKRMAEAFDLEVERAVKAFTALLEPIMIVIMGVIIGTMVIAMLLPILTMSAYVK